MENRKELVLPDTKQSHIEFLVNYGNKILELNNLNVGDEIEIEFDYDVLRSQYKSRERSRFNFKKLAKGILKLDENNCLIAESIDDFDFWTYTQIRSNKYEWKLDRRKSIKRFGTGFIY